MGSTKKKKPTFDFTVLLCYRDVLKCYGHRPIGRVLMRVVVRICNGIHRDGFE